RFRKEDSALLVAVEDPSAIRRERREHRFAGRGQFTHLIGEVSRGNAPRDRAKAPGQAGDFPSPSLQRPPKQAEIKLVYEQALGRKPLTPAFVDRAAERVRPVTIKLGRDRAADDVMVDGKAGVADRLQHRIAKRLGLIE